MYVLNDVCSHKGDVKNVPSKSQPAPKASKGCSSFVTEKDTDELEYPEIEHMPIHKEPG